MIADLPLATPTAVSTLDASGATGNSDGESLACARPSHEVPTVDQSSETANLSSVIPARPPNTNPQLTDAVHGRSWAVSSEVCFVRCMKEVGGSRA